MCNIGENMEEQQNIKVDSKEPQTKDKAVPVGRVTSFSKLKPGSVFRLMKTNSIYVKMRDGSVRNLDRVSKSKLHKLIKRGNK